MKNQLSKFILFAFLLISLTGCFGIVPPEAIVIDSGDNYGYMLSYDTPVFVVGEVGIHLIPNSNIVGTWNVGDIKREFNAISIRDDNTFSLDTGQYTFDGEWMWVDHNVLALAYYDIDNTFTVRPLRFDFLGSPTTSSQVLLSVFVDDNIYYYAAKKFVMRTESA